MFTPDSLLERLLSLPVPARYRVAFSGGGDSTVLLHALAALRSRLPAPFDALHVDHGLQSGSGVWAIHCADVCARLGIAFTGLKAQAAATAGESPEAAARRARYGALSAQMRPGDLLLTAHHPDDQAETLLLQLLRGAGVRGLAAMPVATPFAVGTLARPMLNWTRLELEAWARAEGLEWLDDPSNRDPVFDRNYLRHRLMPAIGERWPAVARVIARSASHLAEAAELLDEWAALDLAAACGSAPGTLSITALRRMSPARCRNALRAAIRGRRLNIPPSVVLARILDEVMNARPDAEPRVAWPGAEVRRYRDDLHLLRELPPVPSQVLSWNSDQPLPMGGLGYLAAEPALGGLDRQRWRKSRVEVRFRAGGERFLPVGRAHAHPLKKLFQEAGVPPWERQRTPLVFLDGKLAAVGERWVAREFAAKPGESGIVLRLDRFFVETEAENDDNLPGPAP